MGANYSSWSAHGGGQGSAVIVDPSLGQGPPKAQFDAASSLRTNMHDLFGMYAFQLREVALLVALGSSSTALHQTILSCNKALDDLGNYFSSFYGPAGGKSIASYLKDGTKHAIDYVHLAKRLYADKRSDVSKQSLQAELCQWDGSCAQLSVAFASLNPGLSYEGIMAQFKRMISLYDQQVTALMEDFNDSSLMRFKDLMNHVRGVSDLIAVAVMSHVNKGKQ